MVKQTIPQKIPRNLLAPGKDQSAPKDKLRPLNYLVFFFL